MDSLLALHTLSLEVCNPGVSHKVEKLEMMSLDSLDDVVDKPEVHLIHEDESLEGRKYHCQLPTFLLNSS